MRDYEYWLFFCIDPSFNNEIIIIYMYLSRGKIIASSYFSAFLIYSANVR